MKHYFLQGNTYIVGLDPIDAIKHNIEKIATTTEWNIDAQRTETTIHPHDEVFADWRTGILGGKGGIEIVMRGSDSTYTVWVNCEKEDWPHGEIKII